MHTRSRAAPFKASVYNNSPSWSSYMPGQGAGSPQAYCTSVSHVHFVFLQCSHSSQSVSQSVRQSVSQSQFKAPSSWVSGHLSFGFDLKISDLSWIRSQAGTVPPSMPHRGGKPTKPWHQISGEAAEAELCNECEQLKKKGGKGAPGSGGGEGREGEGSAVHFQGKPNSWISNITWNHQRGVLGSIWNIFLSRFKKKCSTKTRCHEKGICFFFNPNKWYCRWFDKGLQQQSVVFISKLISILF